MDNGHCQGFSVSALMFTHNIGSWRTSQFGGPTVFSLALPGNTALQRHIAYTFAWQLLPAVVARRVDGSPNRVVDALESVLAHPDRDPATIGIYKPGRVGGHAITPIAVQRSPDRRRASIHVYDNNYPGQVRTIHVDTANGGSWTYEGSPNPNVAADTYAGNTATNTLEIEPKSPASGRTRARSAARRARHRPRLQIPRPPRAT